MLHTVFVIIFVLQTLSVITTICLANLVNICVVNFDRPLISHMPFLRIINSNFKITYEDYLHTMCKNIFQKNLQWVKPE